MTVKTAKSGERQEEISYEENYRLVNDEKQFEKTNNTEEYIENSKEMEEKEEIKGIQRVLKKEAA